MITVDEIIEKLQELSKEGYGNLPCVYGCDMGNGLDPIYHAIFNRASKFKVQDIDDYYLEPNGEFDNEFNVVDFKPNCILIN